MLLSRNTEAILYKLTEVRYAEYELRAGYNEVKEKSFYNCDRIIDSFGQRWVKCKCCGQIKPDFDFIEFGGQKTINFGICEECAKRNR